MDWKKEITTAIDANDCEKLTVLANQSLSKTLRYVQMNIWGDDKELRRWYAIEGLGALTQAHADDHPEEFKNVIRRCLWAMNDESGNVPWAAPEVMGCIIDNGGERFVEFIPMMVTNALENEMCHQGLAWAIGYLAKDYKIELQRFLPQLLKLLLDNDAGVRCYAIYAFAQLQYEPAIPLIEKMYTDTRNCLHYHNGKLHPIIINELAHTVLRDMR